jgi:hypothetical protein
MYFVPSGSNFSHSSRNLYSSISDISEGLRVVSVVVEGGMAREREDERRGAKEGERAMVSRGEEKCAPQVNAAHESAASGCTRCALLGRRSATHLSAVE